MLHTGYPMLNLIAVKPTCHQVASQLLQAFSECISLSLDIVYGDIEGRVLNDSHRSERRLLCQKRPQHIAALKYGSMDFLVHYLLLTCFIALWAINLHLNG